MEAVVIVYRIVMQGTSEFGNVDVRSDPLVPSVRVYNKASMFENVRVILQPQYITSIE
jgi:hypothetical protein